MKKLNWKQKLTLWIGGVLISIFLLIDIVIDAWTGFGFSFNYSDFILPVLIVATVFFITFTLS